MKRLLMTNFMKATQKINVKEIFLIDFDILIKSNGDGIRIVNKY